LDKNLSVLDLIGHALERGANAWPPDTFSRCRFEGRAVVAAQKVPAPIGKTWLSTWSKEYQCEGTGFDSVKRPLIVEEHSIDGSVPIAQGKLLVIPGVSSPTLPTSFLLTGFKLIRWSSISQVRDISFRATHQDVALVYTNRQPIERLSRARARDTQPGSSLVECPVRITHQIPPIFADELIADKIQGCRHVSAPIYVSMKMTTIIYQKPGHPVFLANNREFFYPARFQFRHASDDHCPCTTLLLHAPLVTYEKDPMNRQSEQIGDNKK
jgi:hypothetical protein